MKVPKTKKKHVTVCVGVLIFICGVLLSSIWWNGQVSSRQRPDVPMKVASSSVLTGPGVEVEAASARRKEEEEEEEGQDGQRWGHKEDHRQLKVIRYRQKPHRVQPDPKTNPKQIKLPPGGASSADGAPKHFEGQGNVVPSVPPQGANQPSHGGMRGRAGSTDKAAALRTRKEGDMARPAPGDTANGIAKSAMSEEVAPGDTVEDSTHTESRGHQPVLAFEDVAPGDKAEDTIDAGTFDYVAPSDPANDMALQGSQRVTMDTTDGAHSDATHGGHTAKSADMIDRPQAEQGLGGLMDALQNGYGGGEKRSLCGSGEGPVTKRGYRAYGNGCGTDMFRISDKQFNFTECCTFTHDVCYVTCGIHKTRCEDEFSQCMRGYCEASFKGENHTQCLQTAGMYTMGTTLLGRAFFEEGQRESCECVPTGAVAARQKEEVSSFMQKWAPQEIGSVPALIAQHHSDFPPLMLKLHKQYHHAVRIVLPRGIGQPTQQKRKSMHTKL